MAPKLDLWLHGQHDKDAVINWQYMHNTHNKMWHFAQDLLFLGKTLQRLVYIKSVLTLVLTCNRSRQHARDSERGLRDTAVLPETLRQGTDCIVQSYRTHTCDKVLRAQWQHDHLNAGAHTRAHVYTGPHFTVFLLCRCAFCHALLQ